MIVADKAWPGAGGSSRGRIMSEFVCTNLMDHAYRVELNRPDCGNLVTTEMAKGLPPTLAMAALDKVTAKGLGYLGVCRT